ncbi:MAG TPA: hypothetical protein VEW71_06970 [Allosphingosinicella sp.]|nr:hypothetical protein [Allosphingosinicella sp.]
MIPAALALALALQAPSYMTAPGFVPAWVAWMGCTHRAMDAAPGWDRSDEEIVAAAYAACAAREAAVRDVLVAHSGEARGARQMESFRAADREALIDRARARRSAAAQDALTRAWVGCVLRGIEAAAADAPEGRAVDSALDGCGAEQEAMRRFAVARGGASRASRFIREARALYRRRALDHLRERRGQPASAGD